MLRKPSLTKKRDRREPDAPGARYPCGSPRGASPASGKWLARSRLWTTVWLIVSAVLSVSWLILRSGPRPSRLAYPCQQSALATAAVALLLPISNALFWIRHRIKMALTGHAGLVTLGIAASVTVAIMSSASFEQYEPVNLLTLPDDYHPDLFLVNNVRGIEPGRFGGVDDLVSLMGTRGFRWHRSEAAALTSGPTGMIAANSVVLLKINAQWSQRGGTNTDLIRGVIRRVVEHPDGFTGEVIVADNGQGWGSLNHAESNAEDITQSVQLVVDDFASEGWRVSTFKWDHIRAIGVLDYDAGNNTDGYVVSSTRDTDTLIYSSYPKFQTAFGSYVSYRYGIWSPSDVSFDSDRLVVINMPVLKTHAIYAVTAAVKNHMGVVSTALGTGSHSAVEHGGMGTILAEVRRPDLTILDCIWILAIPGLGPGASYENASRRDQLLAGTDPVALDVWATKNILIPQIIENGYQLASYHSTQDPDNPTSLFRHYLDGSMNELLRAGVTTTNVPEAARVHVWVGDIDRDGDVDFDDHWAAASCTSGPGQQLIGDCVGVDLDGDGDFDLGDFKLFQSSFTGSIP